VAFRALCTLLLVACMGRYRGWNWGGRLEVRAAFILTIGLPATQTAIFPRGPASG